MRSLCWFDLGLLTSNENSNHGQENTRNLGFKSLLRKVKTFLSFFLFIFKLKIDLPEQGFEPQVFSNFPAHDLNFHLKWGARDQNRTLTKFSGVFVTPIINMLIWSFRAYLVTIFSPKCWQSPKVSFYKNNNANDSHSYSRENS